MRFHTRCRPRLRVSFNCIQHVASSPLACQALQQLQLADARSLLYRAQAACPGLQLMCRTATQSGACCSMPDHRRELSG